MIDIGKMLFGPPDWESITVTPEMMRQASPMPETEGAAMRNVNDRDDENKTYHYARAEPPICEDKNDILKDYDIKYNCKLYGIFMFIFIAFVLFLYGFARVLEALDQL